MRHGLLVLLICAGAAQAQQVKPQVVARDPKAPQARQQAAGKGVIAGVVVSADAGTAVRRAHVSLSGGTPEVERSLQSDDQGGFRFTDLPPGEYTLTSSKGGYVETIFGQKQPGSGRPGTPIPLLADQELTHVSMPIARGGVITGAVLEETGEPAFGESVQLLRWVMDSGERTLKYVASATTDDRGIYRFPALRTGDYVVGTTGTFLDGDYDLGDGAFFKILKPNGVYLNSGTIRGSINVSIDPYDSGTTGTPPTTGFAAVYYPGVTDVAAAMTVSVAVGEEHGGIDFHLQPVPMGRLSGVVTGPDGPVPGVEVQLVDRGQPPGIHVHNIRAGKDGRFTFNGVTPGQYTLFAHATAKTVKVLDVSQPSAADEKKRAAAAAALAASADLWAMTDARSDGRDVDDVSLVLQAGLAISGHVVVESGSSAPPNLSRLMLAVEGVGPSMTGDDVEPPPAVVDENGDFTIHGVFPGKYRIAVAAGAPAGYTIRSAIFGGQDVLDVPMQLSGNEHPPSGVVTLTSRTTQVSGAVLDAAGQPAPGVTVIAFSAEERFWTPQSRRIQAVRPSTDGQYRLKNLPPGDYRLVALADVEPGRWFDPGLLRTLGGFTTLTIGDGARLTQEIRVK